MKLVYAFLFTSLLFSVNTLHAQFKKGTIQLGLDGASKLVVGDRFALEDWIFMPEGSYFILDNLSIGLSGFRSRATGGSSELKKYNIGLLSRYHFYRKGSFSMNIENYLGMGEVIASSEVVESYNFRTSLFRVGVGIGINYYVHSNVAFAFGVRGNRDFLGDDFISGPDPVDFRFGVRVNFNSSE